MIYGDPTLELSTCIVFSTSIRSTLWSFSFTISTSTGPPPCMYVFMGSLSLFCGFSFSHARLSLLLSSVERPVGFLCWPGQYFRALGIVGQFVASAMVVVDADLPRMRRSGDMLGRQAQNIPMFISMTLKMPRGRSAPVFSYVSMSRSNSAHRWLTSDIGRAADLENCDQAETGDNDNAV